MKQNNNGFRLIAAVCLVSACVGAEEMASYLNDTSLTSQGKVSQELNLRTFDLEASGKSKTKWLDEASALDAPTPIAWSFIGINSFQFHADCLSHNYDLIRTRQLMERLSFYYGLGGRIKLKETNPGKGNVNEEARLGMRSPLGVAYVLQEQPVELFAEVVPILDILPETRLGVGLGVGARYTFSLL